MARFRSQELNGLAVQELEVLVRTVVFKSANGLVGFLLQEAANRIDAAYQPKVGQQYKGRVSLRVEGMFGSFLLERDYYHHEGKKQGHYPADAALGLESGHTPALTRLMCLEGADETSYQKAELHLAETGGIHVGARQIQRMVQRVGAAAQAWQEREAQPGGRTVPIMYVSADGTGVPMRKEELAGRAGQQPDGSAKTRMAYPGCVFTQQRTDEQGHPVRDYESTTYVSRFGPIEEFGPCLRQDAIRRGLALALQAVLLIDGAEGLANMGRLCFPSAIQIVDFYHALEHAGKVLLALLGSKEPPEYKRRLGRWARRLANVHCRRTGRTTSRVTTLGTLDKAAAFRPGADPDSGRRCLHELFEAADRGLLGSARTHHRHRLRRRRMAECKRQSSAIAPDPDAGAALACIPARDEHDAASGGAAKFQRRHDCFGYVHLTGARHIYRRNPYSFLANVPPGPDHGAWHSGACVDREFGFACRADRSRGTWHRSGILVAWT